MAQRAAISALALALGTAPAGALGPLERMEPRLSQAIEEHKVFLTCSSLEPGAAAAAQRHWTRMAARARSILVANRATKEDLATFDKRTAVAALIDEGRPLADAISFCRRHADWFKRYAAFDFVAKIDETPLPQRR